MSKEIVFYEFFNLKIYVGGIDLLYLSLRKINDGFGDLWMVSEIRKIIESFPEKISFCQFLEKENI